MMMIAPMIANIKKSLNLTLSFLYHIIFKYGIFIVFLK